MLGLVSIWNAIFTSSLIVFGKIYNLRNPSIYQRRGHHCTGEELVWVSWGRILQPALQILSWWCCSSRDQDGPQLLPIAKVTSGQWRPTNIWLWKSPIGKLKCFWSISILFGFKIPFTAFTNLPWILSVEKLANQEERIRIGIEGSLGKTLQTQFPNSCCSRKWK